MSDRQNADKPRPNGHTEPTYVSHKDHHKVSPVDSGAVRGHARGADMETPPGHTPPTFVPAQPQVAGAVEENSGLAERMAGQKAAMMDNQLGRSADGANTDRG